MDSRTSFSLAVPSPFPYAFRPHLSGRKLHCSVCAFIEHALSSQRSKLQTHPRKPAADSLASYLINSGVVTRVLVWIYVTQYTSNSYLLFRCKGTDKRVFSSLTDEKTLGPYVTGATYRCYHRFCIFWLKLHSCWSGVSLSIATVVRRFGSCRSDSP